MIKVTVIPIDGNNRSVDYFRTPQEAVEFINWCSVRPAPKRKLSPACANFKKAIDGRCYNCGYDKKSHKQGRPVL